MTDEKSKGRGGHSIKDVIVEAIKNSGNVYTAAVDTVSLAVRHSLSAARQAGSSAVGAVTSVASGAMRGALECDSDLGEACKGILVGVLLGTRERGEAALRTISRTARSVIHHTSATGSDVTGATGGLVDGAIRSAKDSGEEVTRAASAAAQGALEGAEEVSYSAAEQVRTALKSSFEGVRIYLLPPYQQQER